jgi:hypothetical protein
MNYCLQLSVKLRASGIRMTIHLRFNTELETLLPCQNLSHCAAVVQKKRT